MTPATAQAAGAPICTGTAKTPGVLAGAYRSGVRIIGVCTVNGGATVVRGTVTVEPNAALIAAFALNDITGRGRSSLQVRGRIVVESGGTLLLGCDRVHFPCLDDPNPAHPTLSNGPHVSGAIRGLSPLGIVVHDATINGNVNQSGGGGGETCKPSGIFAKFKSPVYSDYEDTTIRGNFNATDYSSCWMGNIRNTIRGNSKFVDNQLADPDAIEIISNHIAGNLTCRRNSMVWNSADLTNNLFPRQPGPNTVLGTRAGQCVLASPTSPGGPPGPGPF